MYIYIYREREREKEREREREREREQSPLSLNASLFGSYGNGAGNDRNRALSAMARDISLQDII